MDDKLPRNVDDETVAGFGDEWSRLDQRALIDDHEEHQFIFDGYFSIFPWDKIDSMSVGYDLGCGSGRWAKLVAPRVSRLHCIDPSSALMVAMRNLVKNENCEFHSASVDAIPLADASMDFGYSLGVLHHVPDTQEALRACVRKLKYGAPFLVYLYYAFDNRPFWFRAIWRLSEILRYGVSRMPHSLRFLTSQAIAGIVYFPLARAAGLLEKIGLNVDNLPLSTYRNCSFYTMRTDALDRFGTRLEQRFTRGQIKLMMEQAGLEKIEFSSSVPFWCAVGYRTPFDSVAS